MNSKRFEYALEPLLVKQRWDVDELAKELSATEAARTTAQTEAEEAQRLLRLVDAEILSNRAVGMTLNVQRDRHLMAFRLVREAACEEARSRLHKATELRDQVQSDLQAANSKLKGYEKHRDRMRREFENNQAKVQEKLADDAWLLASSGKWGNAL